MFAGFKMSDDAGLEFNSSDESRKTFCELYKLAEVDWSSLGIEWSELVEIGRDHLSQYLSLSASAGMYASLIQAIDGVHSVRWRVKSPAHLVSKIIRKKIEGKSEYKNIGLKNYHEIVTDLVGIRALHLFKEDFKRIHLFLQPLLSEKEPPVANIRAGDSGAFTELCRELKIEVRDHAEGYRSVHYVKTVRPMSRDLHIEIQVRTVFEEGWSEVDHSVRYPNLSDDPLIHFASQILNRLSGMADEMSTYSKQLASALEEKANLILAYQNQKVEAFERIEELTSELDGARNNNERHVQLVGRLKDEISRMKASSERESNPINALGAVRRNIGAHILVSPLTTATVGSLSPTIRISIPKKKPKNV